MQLFVSQSVWSDSSERMLYIWKSKAGGDRGRAVGPLPLRCTACLSRVLGKGLHPEHLGLRVLVLTTSQTCWTGVAAFGFRLCPGLPTWKCGKPTPAGLSLKLRKLPLLVKCGFSCSSQCTVTLQSWFSLLY